MSADTKIDGKGNAVRAFSLQEIRDSLQVIGDAAEEAGFSSLASSIRRLSSGHGESGITAGDVLLRAGLSSSPPGGGRRSGRTTWMLAEAVAAHVRGCPVEITAHSNRYERELVMQAHRLALAAGFPDAARDILERAERHSWEPERLEFVDHYAREQSARDRR